jgi:uncharacterized protein YjiS (DUF1127 family)
MNTTALSHPASALLGRTAGLLHDLAAALVAAASRLDARIAARRKAREDAHALATMSERELRDIGLHEASLPRTANASWESDYR